MKIIAALLSIMPLVLASSAFSAGKTCKEVSGKDYPCCCVPAGNFGVCTSKKDCAEISGECVADKEHFRCMTPDSKARAMKLFGPPTRVAAPAGAAASASTRE